MTARQPPRSDDDAVSPAFEDDDIRTTRSAKDALADLDNEPAPPKPRPPTNPGFRNRSWR